MEEPVTCIPGLNHDLRRRDLPSICRCDKADDPVLQFFASEAQAMARASGVILNTFEGLEAEAISRLGSIYPKIYTIGPMHALPKTYLKQQPSLLASSNGILWKEDRSCITWLDSQPLRSVIYVSFGSLVGLSRELLLEFWHGLVNSGKPFLWVIRDDLITGKDVGGQVSVEELEEATKERGCLVSWAPQEEVLSHRATGGFLTHGGWNSTVEGVCAGVPMICWPLLADQQVNSWCVSEVWKIGSEIKDTCCDRSMIEKMVRELMEIREDEMMKTTNETARIARESVAEGGSSYSSLELLVDDIRSMSFAN